MALPSEVEVGLILTESQYAAGVLDLFEEEGISDALDSVIANRPTLATAMPPQSPGRLWRTSCLADALRGSGGRVRGSSVAVGPPWGTRGLRRGATDQPLFRELGRDPTRHPPVDFYQR
jgi:hypothetical protein